MHVITKDWLAIPKKIRLLMLKAVSEHQAEIKKNRLQRTDGLKIIGN
ncbi:hypothetical protein PP175_05430 [Aneurinibacillus sp. Ricciae_BoGa-3]|nr:hypothetical protein [Aneurinibacillus sp. Ricciae_BoGa-3]WCK55394.1 hypothetical protein PP175_05430 [Aneurinibacillus sp. Ricciae_BoGa-3]